MPKAKTTKKITTTKKKPTPKKERIIAVRSPSPTPTTKAITADLPLERE